MGKGTLPGGNVEEKFRCVESELLVGHVIGDA